MIDALIIVLIAAVATNLMIETIHHGSIFLRLRMWAEVREGFFPELISCPYCLSHWAGWFSVFCLGWGRFNVVQLVILGFAAARVAQLINDLLYDHIRTPKD